MNALILGKRWIPLISGLSIGVLPITAEIDADCRKAFTETKGHREFDKDGRVYLECHRAYALTMAQHVIFDWRGIGEGSETPPEGDEVEDTPLAFDADRIPELMAHDLFYQCFDEKVVLPYQLAVMEKNASSLLRNGSSQRAVKSIAEPAGK